MYEINPVDAQRLAKSQGWETVFSNAENDLQPEQPCYVLFREGYEITIVGHSLGGGVAALLTYMLKSAIPNIYCVTYGSPSCVDAATADVLKSHVLSIINHDDVISRITPQSIR